MAKIYDRDGVVFLEGDIFDLKVDTNRKIYIKKKEHNSYNFVGHETPYDLRIEEKKLFLSKLNSMLEFKYREQMELQ